MVHPADRALLRDKTRRSRDPHGSGAKDVEYRAAMIGATLEVHSAIGRGTTVTCAFGKHLCSSEQPAGGA